MMRRDDAESLKSRLRALGATHVATYDELSERAFKAVFSSWTQGKVGSSSFCVDPCFKILLGRQTGSQLHRRKNYNPDGTFAG